MALQGSRDELYHLLQHCISKKSLDSGKKVHLSMVCKGLDLVPVLTDHLLRLYTACGSFAEAYQILDSGKPSVFGYNNLMSANAKNGNGDKTFELFNGLLNNGLKPDNCTFLCLLNACGKLDSLEKGKLTYHWIVEDGIELDVVIANTVIDMYSKCQSLEDAYNVFVQLPFPNVVSWAALITGHAQSGNAFNVLELYRKMKSSGVEPNVVIYSCVLKACSGIGGLCIGREIHDEVTRVGISVDVIVGTALVDMYAKCENLDDAQKVFDMLWNRTIVTWNAMISGHCQHGNDASVIHLFQALLKEGIQPDKVTFLAALRTSINKQSLELGRVLHHIIVENFVELESELGNSLIDAYAKCGNLSDAQRIFQNLTRPNVIAFGAIIDGCAEHGDGVLAFEYLELMQKKHIIPNEFIFVSALKACISPNQGRLIHDQVIKSAFDNNVPLKSTIIDMYAKLGSIEEANNCFDRQFDPDVVAWGAIMSGHVQNGNGDLALEMLSKMLQQGVDTSGALFVIAVQACIINVDLTIGNLLHEFIVKAGFQIDRTITNSLIDMYSRCGSVEDAHCLFDKQSDKDVVSWGAIIAGCVQNEQYFSSIEFFNSMQSQDTKPTRAIFLSILKACSSLGIVQDGMIIHSQIIETGIETDVIIANALVTMYIESGNLTECHHILHKLENSDVISWSSLIGGYAGYGNLGLSTQYFEAIKREGLNLDDAAFTNALAACSRAGSLGKSLHYLTSMERDHKITPGFKHFTSVADLLSRAGLFQEAEDILSTVPITEHFTGWTSLLSGCKAYGNLNVGNRCF